MEKARCFLSLNIESSLSAELKLISDNVKEALKQYPVKWEAPEKLHLTLRFLGDVTADNMKGLCFTLERLKTGFGIIRFKTAGAGFFPNPKYPNVVYIGLEEEGDNSQRLVELIDKIIYNFGVKPEKRFIPHITLGRFRKDKRVKIAEEPGITVKPVDIEFTSFFLMKSILTPSGSVYEPVKEFKFNN